MKKLVFAAFLILFMGVSFASFGQERDKEEKKAKDAEREFFEEREVASERARVRAEESERAAENAGTAERARVAYKTQSGNTYFSKPDYPSPPAMSYSSVDGIYVMSSSGSSSSQLSLSKSFDGQSSDSEGTFDVDESVRQITLTLSGRVKEGEIQIIITLPDGDELKDITINTSADIRFSQSIKIAEDEDRYFGKWEYSVESEKAVGDYQLSIQTR